MNPAVKVLNDLRSLNKLESLTERLQRCWRSAVGKRIADHSRVIQLRGKELVVAVDDAIWKRQLEQMRGQVRDRIVEVSGISEVESVLFRVSPARIPPRMDDTPLFGADEADRIADPTLRKSINSRAGWPGNGGERHRREAI